MVRVHCVRLEAYDLPAEPGLQNVRDEFEPIFAKVENDPRLARALIDLRKTIAANEEQLESIAG